YLRNLSTSPSYLFKYNLAKIGYLMTETKPTIASLVGFKVWMDDTSFDDVLAVAMEDRILNTSDAVMLAKMFVAVENGDLMLSTVKDISAENDRFAFVKHVASSYLKLLDLEASEKLLTGIAY